MFVYELNDPFVFDFCHDLKSYAIRLPKQEREEILSIFHIAINWICREDRRFNKKITNCIFGAIPRELRQCNLHTWPDLYYLISQDEPKMTWLVSTDPWGFFKDEFNRRMNIRRSFMVSKHFEYSLSQEIAEEYLGYPIWDRKPK